MRAVLDHVLAGLVLGDCPDGHAAGTVELFGVGVGHDALDVELGPEPGPGQRLVG